MQLSGKTVSRLIAVAAITSAAALPAAAGATVITTDYTFSGTFATGSYSSLAGSFTLSYDTGKQSYTLDAIALKIGSTQYTTTNSGVDLYNNLVNIGGLGNSPHLINLVNNAGPNDFQLSFSFNSATGALGTLSLFNYVEQHVSVIHSQTRSYAIVATPAPEPATWAMFIGGFGLIGGALRASRRRTAIRFA